MILHITNDFNLTKVHKELYYNLDQLGIKQKIFIPLRTDLQIGNNHFNFVQNESEYIYSDKLQKYHKLFFKKKINHLYNSLINNIDYKQVTITHATTLFSDGAIAYKLYKSYNIPYIVAIRNTDLNIYFKYRKDLIPLGKEILLNAKKIIFISESNRRSFFDLTFIKSIFDKIEDKIALVNNGIDDVWINNVRRYKKKEESYNFLFIGRFDKNKNTELLIRALQILRNDAQLPITLTLVGGTGNRHARVIEVISKKSWINYKGEVFDIKELQSYFSSHDYFSMISHTETFGLVYIEALSQGLPLLYTENQGVYNSFPFKIGEYVDSKNLENIVIKLKEILKSDYSEINKIDFEKYRWCNIAQTYLNIYNENI